MFSIEDIALCLLESIVHYQNHFFLLIAIILPNRKVLEYDLRCYKIYKKIFRIHILRFNACMHQKFLQNNHILFKDTILYTYFDLWTTCNANCNISVNIFHLEIPHHLNVRWRISEVRQRYIHFMDILKRHMQFHQFILYLARSFSSKLCNIDDHKLSFMLDTHLNQIPKNK